jgi:hypothetical protein
MELKRRNMHLKLSVLIITVLIYDANALCAATIPNKKYQAWIQYVGVYNDYCV